MIISNRALWHKKEKKEGQIIKEEGPKNIYKKGGRPKKRERP